MQHAPTNDLPQSGPPVYELSGWWRRVGAEVLDSFLVLIVASTFVNATGIGEAETTVKQTSDSLQVDWGLEGVGFLIYFIVGIFMMAGIMAITNGKTVGMMATQIRVVREGGEAIGFGFAFQRQILVKQILFGYLSLLALGIPTLLNYLWPLWDDNNQALHDKICNTRVVRDANLGAVDPLATAPPPVQAPAPPAPPVPPAPPAPPAPPGVYQPPQGFENPVPEDK